MASEQNSGMVIVNPGDPYNNQSQRTEYIPQQQLQQQQNVAVGGYYTNQVQEQPVQPPQELMPDMTQPRLPQIVPQQINNDGDSNKAKLVEQQKFHDMNNFYVTKVQSDGGCCDTGYMLPIGNKWDINAEKKQKQFDFQIRITPPDCCYDTSQGFFYGLYESEDIREFVPMYSVTHNRNFCCVKCIFGFVPCVGCIPWCALTNLFKPKGFIRKNDKVIATYKMVGACSTVIEIYDPNTNQLKFRVDTNLDGYKNVYNSEGMIMPIKVNATDKNGDNKNYKQFFVEFQKQIEDDDKALILYGIGKMME